MMPGPRFLHGPGWQSRINAALRKAAKLGRR
jgi:uncharacterized protein (DUF4415 family)